MSDSPRRPVSCSLLPAMVAIAGLAIGDQAKAQNPALLDFEFTHGTVISNQYQAVAGITISATGGENIAIVYDSELGGVDGDTIHGQDPDLERLSFTGSQGGNNGTLDPGGWDGGNLGRDYMAGGLLIIQENGPLSSPPTYSGGSTTVASASNYDPDDNVGGTITFDIDSANFNYNYFQATLADFEAATED